MYLAMLHLTPILGAEKSKVPFYIAGGVLVLWALIISLGFGMRKPDFPGSKQGERAIIGVTLVLVAVTAAMAVITAEPPSKPASSPPGFSDQLATIGEPTPGAAAPAASTAPESSTTKPTATTGTPAPASSPGNRVPSTKLALAANPSGQLAYNTKQLAARAGLVTIVMANMSPVEHNVTVASGSKVLGATPTFAGGSRSLELTLKPGTYTFYCSVPGHRQAGMEGTLTVTQ